jgi:hypothetical protein
VLLVVGLFSWLLPVTPASAQGIKDPTGLLMSENIERLDTLPNAGVIGARFKGTNMYVTSVTGLMIYDVSKPQAPKLLSETSLLPLPHFENEDVDLGGGLLLISNDAAESTGILYPIDIRDPKNPKLLTPFNMGGNPAEGGPGHTASCINNCDFAWVTDGGGILVLDLRDVLEGGPAKVAGDFTPPNGGGIATHDVQVDPNGYAWIAGFNGTVAYKIPKNYEGEDLKPVTRTNRQAESTYMDEFGLGDGSNYNDFIHHNSLRRKGDKTVFITEEDYTRPMCQGAGSFQSWKLPLDGQGRPDSDRKLQPLDKWETELVRDKTAAAAMCSAHYFDLKRNVVAQGWYEQGMRLLDVSNPSKIRQIGYFVLPKAMTWAAYFPPTDPGLDTIYVFDATAGISVLKVARPARGPLSSPAAPCGSQACKERNAPPTLRAPIRNSWRVESPSVMQKAGTKKRPFGWACRVAFDLPVDL